MAWLSGWSYRRKITISGSSGAGTDYQVLLKIGESSGATGCHFHLDYLSANFPSGKNQGGDLRFTADDGVTLLSFWVEAVQGTSPNRVASIWVKIAADLGTSQDIYCYFGNASATNTSNGDATFLLFDDFDGTSLDPNKWISVGDYNISNSVIQINPNHTSNSGTVDGISVNDGIYSSSTFNFPVEIRMRVTGHTAYVRLRLGLLGLFYNYDDGGSSWWGLLLNQQRVVTWGYDVPSNGIVGDVLTRITSTTFYLKDPSTNTPQTWNYGLNNNLNNYRAFVATWADSDTSIDFITIRKYVSPEPAFSLAEPLEASGWPKGWRYRRKITIAGSSGAGTGYQVLLKVGESSGASGCHFHLDGKSENFPSGKNQGGDLRFTADDGKTFLSFWVEKVQGSSPNRVAYVWVKVLADLSTDQSIFCYFGNSSASNGSDGVATFLFFDDFDGTSLNTTKWTVVEGSPSVSSSILSLPATSRITSTSTMSPTNLIFEGRTLVDSQYRMLEGFANRFLNYDVPNSVYHEWQIGSCYYDGLDPTPNTFQMWRIEYSSSQIKSYLDDNYLFSCSDVDLSSQAITIRHWYQGTAQVDYIRVRKYASPEPAFSSASGIQVPLSSRRLLLMPI